MYIQYIYIYRSVYKNKNNKKDFKMDFEIKYVVLFWIGISLILANPVREIIQCNELW